MLPTMEPIKVKFLRNKITPPPPPTHLSNLDHVELLHVRACHFDVILHEEGGDRPVLEAARLSS